MALLTPKENYLRVGRHEIPEYVPSLIPFRDRNIATCPAGIFAMQFGQNELKTGWQQPYGEWKDFWGANFILHEGYPSGIPKPGAFAFDDIRKWDHYIRWPKVTRIDFGSLSRSELSKIDRSTVAVTCDVGFEPFQQLVALMGFSEALCALHEEPGKVKEMLNYLCDWYIPLIEMTLAYWRPDIVTIADDTAAKFHPFFSLETFRDIFKPIYKRLLEPAHAYGALIDFHNCGKCEMFIPDMVELGVNYWNPCELDNNLFAVKTRYGGQIALNGCWYYNIKKDDPQDKIRYLVREYLDTFAIDGGLIAMAFAGNLDMTLSEAPQWKRANYWIYDELYKYGTQMYK